MGLAARFVSGYLFVPNVAAGRAGEAAQRMRGCRSTCRGLGGSIVIRPIADREPQPYSCGRRLGSQAGVAIVGHLGSAASVLGMDVTVTVTEERAAAV